MTAKSTKWIWISLGVVLLVAGIYAVHFGAAAYRDSYPETETAELAELLQLRPGMTVAEIGAGNGRMAIPVARVVGPEGAVLATELGEEKLEALETNIDEAGLTNVSVIEAKERVANLPARCCEAIFMVKVYHHFTDPASMNASLMAALHPGGRLAVIDFPPSLWLFWATRPAGVPEDRGHGISHNIVIQELQSAGFVIEHEILDWWTWPQQRYCIVARKPLPAAESQKSATPSENE